MTQPRAEIFQRIKQSPEYRYCDKPERLARLPALNPLKMAVPLAVLGLMALIVLTMLWQVWEMVAGDGRLQGFALIFVAIGGLAFVAVVLMGFFYMRRLGQFSSAPVHGNAAIVTGKRQHITSGRRYVSNYVTLEFDNGQRTEFETIEESLFARLSDNDTGVAFTREKILIDFDRVELETP